MRHVGYDVVGVYLSEKSSGGAGIDLDLDLDLDVPILGKPADLVGHLRSADIDAVAISGTHVFSEEGMRSIAWRLHDTGIRLLVAPDLVEIAGPRIISRPAAGLPMLLVEEPNVRGAAQMFKCFYERVTALVMCVMLAPVFAVIAVAVKVTSPGPVLFKQKRVARDGDIFEMLKFRSMIDGAHAIRNEDDNEHDGVLYKVKDDPRITKVGKFLRRYSLDELPQLWNVVRGEMAIVGPRPPLPDEVARYEGEMGRRLLVKPGITGLWQVSGRSDLSWEETKRLDLHYVENWSPGLDVVILAKTFRAVFGGHGAY